MKEEDELLRKCGTKNPFTVPEGYFENFSKELMEKLPEKEISLSEPVITTWQRVKPWIYMTAMFCGLMLSVRVFVGRPKQDTPIFTAAEAAEFSDEYIETIMEHSMMDDYTLYQYLTEADTETYNLFYASPYLCRHKRNRDFLKKNLEPNKRHISLKRQN